LLPIMERVRDTKDRFLLWELDIWGM
jgi:hypothetical protein